MGYSIAREDFSVRAGSLKDWRNKVRELEINSRLDLNGTPSLAFLWFIPPGSPLLSNHKPTQNVRRDVSDKHVLNRYIIT